MFGRIVAAYDGSEAARAALEFVLALAQRAGCEVTIAHALQPIAGGGTSVASDSDAALREARRDWERRLAAAVAGAPPGVAVQGVVCEGAGATALLDLAEQLDADLLAAGTHGVGGLKRFLLGGFSQRLLEHAPCSVLLFRGPLTSGAAPNVLVGLDGSEPSRRALGVAAGLAAALPACLVIVHVADYHVPFAAAAGSDVHSMLRQELRRHGRSVLAEARRTLVAPLEVVREDLREGYVREQLIAACKEHEPAIAVVGSRGEGGFRGLLLGSTARDLVAYGSCPVLVVRDISPGSPRVAREASR